MGGIETSASKDKEMGYIEARPNNGYNYSMSLSKSFKNIGLKEKAYLAGLIDGEGTITLTRRRKDLNRYLAVTISNTEKKMLDWVKATLGMGNITSKKTYSQKHSRSYTYQVFSRQAIHLIEYIYPYLQTYKKERAELALENYEKLTPLNGKYTPELLKKREEFIKNFFSIKANKQ